MNILKGLKQKFNKKVIAAGATVGAVATMTTVSCFAADPAVGTLPTEVNTMFSNLATGLIATIAAVAVIALGVYAAPQAIVFAKKIFKRIGS